MMVTHPETDLTVATLSRPARRWMLMLWDGQGDYMATQLHRTRRDAIQALRAHCISLGVPVPDA